MPVAAWIVVGVLVLVVALLLLGVAVVVLLRRLQARVRRLLDAELAASGEPVLRGPDAGVYRGGTAPGFSKLKGNCLVVLTDRRLVYRMFVGQGGEIARDRIVGVREAKAFLGSRVGGQTHLILQLADGEVGFFIQDHPEWLEALAL